MDPKPYPFTPYLQASVAVAALLIGVSAMVATFNVWRSERNARSVEIGISVLRADPKKEPSAAAARKWALDLIDANAGGIKFSDEARQKLIDEPLTIDLDWGGGSYRFEPAVYDGSVEPTKSKRPPQAPKIPN